MKRPGGGVPSLQMARVSAVVCRPLAGCFRPPTPAKAARMSRRWPFLDASHFRNKIRADAAVGIDLGTTSSMIAIIKDGIPMVLPDAQGRASMPSLVSYAMPPGEGGLKVAVGWDAQSMGLSDAGTETFHSVKRLIGRNAEHVASFCHSLGFDVFEDEAGCLSLQSKTGRCKHISTSPEEVSALVLKELLLRAHEATGEMIETAVIAVPAHFDEFQKEATKAAGRIAGLKHVELLQEPVASAMASGLAADSHTYATILVFDLGGGTFDVSILDCSEGILEVLSTDGNSFLGGDNWDEALIKWVLEALNVEGEEFITDAMSHHLLRASVRDAKEKLSQQATTDISIKFSSCDRDCGLKLSRKHMEDVCQSLFRELWPPLERIGADTMLAWDKIPAWVTPTIIKSPADQMESRTKGDLVDSIPDKYAPPPRRITHIVLAGAASTMPCVLQLIQTVTGMNPEITVDPQEAVALGAAVHAGLLSGELHGGIELMDGSYVSAQHGRSTGFHSNDQIWRP